MGDVYENMTWYLALPEHTQPALEYRDMSVHHYEFGTRPHFGSNCTIVLLGPFLRLLEGSRMSMRLIRFLSDLEESGASGTLRVRTACVRERARVTADRSPRALTIVWSLPAHEQAQRYAPYPIPDFHFKNPPPEPEG